MGAITAELVETGERRGAQGRRVTPVERRNAAVEEFGRSGLTMIECYDADTALSGGFANLSVRAEMRSSDLVVGLAVEGSGWARLLVRAVGPSLSRFGVAGTVLNPRLRV